MKLSILYIGSISFGETSYERMLAFKELGYEVTGLQSAPGKSIPARMISKLCRIIDISPDLSGLNSQIRKHCQQHHFDIIWVDKGLTVTASTLKFIKQVNPACQIVHLNPDDPFGKFRKGWSVFLKSIPFYDVHFVARTQNIEEFRQYGATRTIVYDRSFSPLLHKPLKLAEAEYAKYAARVGFVGMYAPEREKTIAYLIQRDIPVAVYGNDWPDKPYWNIIKPHYRGPSKFGSEYPKIINGMEIALHFLRKENRDEQDSRTFEIPACGTFMIAERTPKHESFFKENEEVVFFDSDETLFEKVSYYLNHPQEARKIAERGYRRCIDSGYDHKNRMQRLLNSLTISPMQFKT
jgi:hypothetical protein